MAHVVGRIGALGAEVLAVLGNQDEAGVGAVVDGLGPRVAEAVGEIAGEALVHVDEQAVILGIPSRGGFKVDGKAGIAREWLSGARWRKSAEVRVLGADVAV